MIEIDKDSYRWHPALEPLRECGYDPLWFDNHISTCTELGAPPGKVLVCKHQFSTGEDYALISSPYDVDAYFEAFKYGRVAVEVVENIADIVSSLSDVMNVWPKRSAIHQSDFIHELKLWLEDINERSNSKTIGDYIGMKRSTVSNLLRLQNLDSEVKKLVSINAISLSKAKTLVSLDVSSQRRLAKLCVDLNWSYRALYEKAFPDKVAKGRGKKNIVKSPDVIRFERVVSQTSGLDVSFEPITGKMNKGVLRINFGTLGEMERMLELVSGSSDSEIQKGVFSLDIENTMQLEKIFRKLIMKDNE